MSADPLAFLTDPTSGEDPLAFLSSPQEKQPQGRKAGRLAAQYGIGLAETAALPYEFAVAPVASKSAQHAEYRKGIFEDIERLQEQKQTGVWDEKDEELLTNLKEQIKQPKKAEKFVKTADIGIGKLAEKAAQPFGVDLRPEDAGEDVARIVGNILNPKSAMKLGQKAVSAISKEGRQATKIEALTKAAKGSPEKEGLLNFAKSKNLSPEAATLLMQSKGKVENLGKIARHTKKFKGAIEELNQKLGANYEELKRIGREGGYLGARETDRLTDNLTKLLDDIGRTFVEGPDTKAARTAIQEAILKIENKGGTVEDLINSRLNLGQGINWKNIDPKGEMLNKARKAFLDAIETSNPKIAKELAITDKAWRKYKNFEKLLDKKQAKVSILGVEIPNVPGTIALGLAGTLALGTGAAVKGLIGKELIQRLSTKMLVDPKYQSLHRRLVDAVLQGSTKKQKEILITFKKMLQKDDPELYDEISGLVVD